VVLGDCLILVEVELFEDSHDAVLYGGKPKDLHADLIDDLALVEIVLGWRKLRPGSISL
jgi:hypothetical protein